MIVHAISKKDGMRKLKCAVKCKLLHEEVKSLADYFAILSSMLKDSESYWFRGHQDINWSLKPSALRYDTVDKRQNALNLMRDFRRVAEIKLDRPPGQQENLKWMQLAQHYGIPTRLLDWTESALFALYFACADAQPRGNTSDGIVFLFNPKHLNKLPGKRMKNSLDAHLDERLIEKYFKLGPNERKNGTPNIAIKPVWNSERLMIQRGVFTLHGSKNFEIDNSQVPSLIGIAVLKENKLGIREQLDRIGVDEMTLFPELEYSCINIKRRSGL